MLDKNEAEILYPLTMGGNRNDRQTRRNRSSSNNNRREAV